MPHPLPSPFENGPKVHVQFFIPETPFDSDLDANATREQGRPIYKTNEYVRIINPSDPLNKPVCLAHEKRFKVRQTGDWISYAQAYPEEYRQFKAGIEEQTSGTPLTELAALSAAKRAELRAVGITNIENLAALDGPPLKRLGMEGTALKSLAQSYLDRAKGMAGDVAIANENAALKARLEAMEDQIKMLASGGKPPVDTNDENPPSDDPFEGSTDEDLKVFIKSRTGEVPRGRVSHETLHRMATELLAKEMAEAA